MIRDPDTEEFVDEYELQPNGASEVIVRINDNHFVFTWEQIELLNQAVLRARAIHQRQADEKTQHHRLR